MDSSWVSIAPENLRPATRQTRPDAPGLKLLNRAPLSNGATCAPLTARQKTPACSTFFPRDSYFIARRFIKYFFSLFPSCFLRVPIRFGGGSWFTCCRPSCIRSLFLSSAFALRGIFHRGRVVRLPLPCPPLANPTPRLQPSLFSGVSISIADTVKLLLF